MSGRFKIIFKRSTSGMLGFVLSISLLVIMIYLIVSSMEIRMLCEGAKELVSIINHKSFFFLHPERLLLVVSQILPVLGIKLNLSLNMIMHLFNVNLIFVTLLIYLCCLFFKDYHAGVYLATFQVIGINHFFYVIPFIESTYMLIFSYLLLLWLKKQPDSKYTPFIIIPLIILIVTTHPMGVFFTLLILLALDLKRNQLYLFSFTAILIFLASLVYTDISIESRVISLNPFLIPERVLYFLILYPDLAALYAVSLYLVFQFKNKYGLLLIFLASSFPYIFFYQFPLAWFMLPSGLSILLFASYPKLNKSIGMMALLVCLFAFNIYRTTQFEDDFQERLSNVNELITLAQEQEGSKFILLKNEETLRFYDDPVDYSLDESIPHNSMLFSTKNNAKTVVINSYEFNKEFFSIKSEMGEDEASIVSFIETLYDDNTIKTLHDKYADKFEYSKYYFTTAGINLNYFRINPEDKYQILRSSNQ